MNANRLTSGNASLRPAHAICSRIARNKKIRACSCRAVAALSAISLCCRVLPVSAAQEIVLSIDRVSVTLSQLQAQNYQIPVFVRLEQNAGINAAEYILQTDSRCTCQCITSPAASYKLTGTCVIMEMTSSAWFGEQYRRFLWASGSQMQETGSVLLLLLTLPEEAAPGDRFAISYLPELTFQNTTYRHLWGCSGAEPKDYTSPAFPDGVCWSDGWIEILPECVTGDVDGSGSVDILDVVQVNKRILGKLPAEALAADADFNGDGVVAPLDALLLLKYVVGLLDSLGAG